MLKRRWSVILALVFLVFAFFLKNYLSGLKQDPPRAPEGKSLKELAVLSSENTEVIVPLNIAGRLKAVSRAELYSEVNGILLNSSKEFRTGMAYSAGETILRIDDSEARLSLNASKSNMLNSLVQMMPDLKADYPESYSKWKNYLDALDVNKTLNSLPAINDSREKYFVASRNIISQYYSIQSQEARLAKYTIKAPFNGILSDALVNSGTLIRPNQKLGDFVTVGEYELEASVTASDLSLLKPGASVELKSNEIAGSWTGKVKRVNEVLDAGTQTVKVFIGVYGKELKEGMFLSGNIDTKAITEAMLLPRSLLIDKGRIWVVKDSTLIPLNINIIRYSNNNMVVSGLENGTMVLAEPLAGGSEGMKVKAIIR